MNCIEFFNVTVIFEIITYFFCTTFVVIKMKNIHNRSAYALHIFSVFPSSVRILNTIFKKSFISNIFNFSCICRNPSQRSLTCIHSSLYIQLSYQFTYLFHITILICGNSELIIVKTFLQFFWKIIICFIFNIKCFLFPYKIPVIIF